MSVVRDLHHEAMHLAQDAMVARESGDLPQAVELARRALALEQDAADRIPKNPESEPTRSILYRSAASLAYQAQDYALAQRLVAEGLAGYPPSRVEQELKDLFEQINEASHPPTGDIDSDESLPRTYRGVLDVANARGNGALRMTTYEGYDVELRVENGIDELVRTHFNRHVQVTVRDVGKSNVLLHVNNIEGESRDS